ncbi:MAG: ABC transporter ATP-binding protein [Patescibacteria group bacterium]
MIIETLGLTKYYGKTRGIEDLNLSVKEGEIFGFLGPNGAGKTTTIRLLLDFIHPTSGQAKIFGLDSQKNSLEIRQRIGYIPGEINLYRNMRGRDLLNYLARFYNGLDSVFILGLTKHFKLDLERKTKTYSKGMKQIFGIIQAFMNDPDLLVLDEPTSGLDPFMQQEIYNLFRETKNKGKTIFLCSHNLYEVKRVCDRVGIVREGRLVALENIDPRNSHLEERFMTYYK